MTVSLTKGANVSLTKEAGGSLGSLTVGLGWDARTTTGEQFDLDASCILVTTEGRVRGEGDFVFYGNKTSSDGHVVHQGDNLTGEGAGDDEQIKMNVGSLAGDVDRIVVAVSIYDAETRSQSFGQVRNAYIRVVNDANGTELARYDLSEDASTETAMIFGEVYRNGPDWKFKAVGQGYQSGLKGIATDFGINVG